MGDRSEIVPVSSGIMTCKILCLDGCSVLKRYSRLKLKHNLDNGEEGAAVHRTKRLNQEKHSNSSSNSLNGTGRQNMNNIERYTDHDRSRDANPFPEDDSFEEEDHYQTAPVYTDSNHNGSNSNQSSAKASPAKRSIVVENLLDNEDPSELSSVSNKSRTTTPTAKSTPRSPAAVVQPPPKQYAAPIVEQEQDMFHFDGIYFSCFSCFDLFIPVIERMLRSIFEYLCTQRILFTTLSAADTKKSTKAGSSLVSTLTFIFIFISIFNSIFTSVFFLFYFFQMIQQDVPEVPLSREELVSRREAALEGKVKEALVFKQEVIRVHCTALEHTGLHSDWNCVYGNDETVCVLSSLLFLWYLFL